MTDRLAKSLASYTPARVGLEKSGVSLATREVLDFQLAHAQARDAVHAAMDTASLVDGLSQRGLTALLLHSAASDRASYLRHPELGRTLSQESAGQIPASRCDVVFVIADGLSAIAVDRHVLPLLDAALPLFPPEWRIGPACVVEQARVAIGDVVGSSLGAKCSVVLIGERPGLSSPDSLGAYITWEPRPGRTDAERNCISNIRPEGLNYEVAALKLVFYLRAARAQMQTGFALKDAAGELSD